MGSYFSAHSWATWYLAKSAAVKSFHPQREPFDFKQERKKLRSRHRKGRRSRSRKISVGSDNTQNRGDGDGAQNCLNVEVHIGDTHRNFEIPTIESSNDELNDVNKLLAETVERNEAAAQHFLFAITLKVIDRIEENNVSPYSEKISKGPTEFVQHLRFLKEAKALTSMDLSSALVAMGKINKDAIEV